MPVCGREEAEGDVPLLELDLRVVRARLGPDELLEVADCVVWTALHTDCEVGVNMKTQMLESVGAHLCGRDGRWQ